MSCPCEIALALQDVAERIGCAIERTGAAPPGVVDAWIAERDRLACPCHRGTAHTEMLAVMAAPEVLP